MKFLIWTGYQNPYWNKATWDNKGIGGSEYCVLKLAEYLTKLGHNVIVGGDVLQGNFEGVQYVHHDKFIDWRGPVNEVNLNAVKVYSHFDVVIAANYLNYTKHLEASHITYDKSYFWLHNTHFYKWFKGNELEDWKECLQSPNLNKIVGVSKYHEDLLKSNAEPLFDYTQEKAIDIISHIDNALDVNDYTNSLDNKVKGRIIWSSSPDRRADLTNLEDVEWKGALNPVQLREEQSKAEYWIYASDYTETYCITALEMMLQKVKIITNGAGNIKNLISDGQRGILIDEIDPDIIINHLKGEYDTVMLNRAYNYALEQSWEERTLQWLNLINDETEKV